jgi:NTP pyrophosphatase (non-canonical NTP hydrolase)
MSETQSTVSDWADSEFGPAPSNMRIGTRANEEMAELLRKLAVDDSHPDAPEEIADVVIILYRLARNLGADLHTEIDRKMAINRQRVWESDGTGHGYHVRDKGAAP